jgi:hypothetical protein
MMLVGCPYARSRRSPCVARDARLALSSDPDPVCRGCSLTPADLAEDLALYHEPAAQLAPGSPAALADEFAGMIREITEPGEEAHREGHRSR